MMIRIFTAVLLIVVVIMGFKQGIAMFNGNEVVLEMFGKFNFSRFWVKVLGGLTILAAIMVLFPQTYVVGNVLMASLILLILCLQLSIMDIRGAMIEVPFLLMNLALIYFQYPTVKK
ncbi:hypothetical protein EZ428_11670 [Pedobacter frigiditerrae]|uniref:DoxX-like family protein n=1 Tax=Pedobacter frigiditerrae TaxID=2530452 RepID=A0A4R0MYN4_9SPHI|nr:hypothetical protein EZ428_11670 [Pedobacter frigiditerrae]